MKIIDDFKAFAMRGNVIDLAVGVVIGASFGKIVSSLVADIITPGVGIIVGGLDFTKLGYTMKNIKGEEVTIAYGNFLQTMFDFLIIAFAIFMFVKVINKAQEKVIKKQKEDAKKEEAKKSDDVVLLEEIRDLLAGNKKTQTVKPIEVKKEVIKPIEIKAAPVKSVAKKTPVKVIAKPAVKKTTTKAKTPKK
ncbi:large-conductance mechanosensitive channel protein MscL [Candidatus Gracilibacteria bacterium]|nr:large-conductance mechanosensitive channel protein MscL [Candidatus Gracilibacteria bacterium]